MMPARLLLPLLLLLASPGIATLHAQSAAATAAATAGPAAQTTDGVRVSFVPQEGARYLRRVHIQSSTEINDKVVSVSDVRATQEEQWHLVDAYWRLRCTPLEVNVHDSGGEFPALLQRLALETPYTIVFDGMGSAKSVLGFDDLETRLKAQLPENAHAPALNLLNADTQRQRIIRNWNTQFAWLFAANWRAGQKRNILFGEQTAVTDSATTFPLLHLEQTITITAASREVVIASFTASGKAQSAVWGSSPVMVEETGNLSITPATGQPLQLQKTRQMRMHLLSEDNQVTTQKRTEVTTITWSRIED